MNETIDKDPSPTTTLLPHSPSRTQQLFLRLRMMEGLVDSASMAQTGARLIFQENGEFRCHKIEDTVNVGRAEDSEIQVNVNGLSRNHFSLQNRMGATIIRDLGSKNGTMVNNEKVERLLLVSGDIVQAGTAMFVYMED